MKNDYISKKCYFCNFIIASFPKKSKLVLKILEALDVEYIFLNHINQLFIFGHCSSISVQNAQKNSEFAEMMIKLKL